MMVSNDQTKEWKSSKSDVFVFLFILFISFLLFHVISSFPRRHSSGNFVENVTSPFHFLFSSLLILVVFSPIWAIRRKYPKRIVLDIERKTIEIESRKRNKSITLDLTSISYQLVKAPLYSYLDFFLTVETRRGNLVTKRVRTILVSNISSAISGKSLSEIVHQLNLLGIEKEPKAKSRGFFELIGE